MEVTVTKLEQSKVEIAGELASAQFADWRSPALIKLNQEVKLDGFRPGHIPEKVLVDTVGDSRILTTMAELALREWYPKILTEQKIDAIGQPEITLTKLAKDNPLGFKIKTAIYPEFQLPDYQAIAKEINQKPPEVPKVEETEVDGVIEQVRRSRAGDKPNAPLPELTDDFAKSLGQFENLADLRDKIKENLKLEKELKARDKRRVEIINEIIKQTTVILPEILITSEIEKMFEELSGQVKSMGLTIEDYLKHLKKEEKDLKAGWRDDADKRVRSALVLSKIATTEKIEATEEEIEKEFKHIKEHHQKANLADNKDGEARLRAYIEHIIVNEKTLRLLEGLKN